MTHQPHTTKKRTVLLRVATFFGHTPWNWQFRTWKLFLLGPGIFFQGLLLVLERVPFFLLGGWFCWPSSPIILLSSQHPIQVIYQYINLQIILMLIIWVLNQKQWENHQIIPCLIRLFHYFHPPFWWPIPLFLFLVQHPYINMSFINREIQHTNPMEKSFCLETRLQEPPNRRAKRVRVEVGRLAVGGFWEVKLEFFVRWFWCVFFFFRLLIFSACVGKSLCDIP